MRTFFFLLTAALLGMLFSGCTAIGLGIGAAADLRNAQAHRVSGTDTTSVPRGRDVEVALTSGDTLRGKFAGFRARPADSYRCAYDSVRMLLAGDSVLPGIGETVSVITPKGRSVSGLFRGLDAGTLAVYRPDDDSTAYLPLSSAAQLRNRDGYSYDLTLLRALVSARSLPSGREFVLQSGGRTCCVPLEHIQEIYAPPHRTSYWILGGVIGLAVDAAVVAVALHKWQYH
jgi:hypothetical protein